MESLFFVAVAGIFAVPIWILIVAYSILNRQKDGESELKHQHVMLRRQIEGLEQSLAKIEMKISAAAIAPSNPVEPVKAAAPEVKPVTPKTPVAVPMPMPLPSIPTPLPSLPEAAAAKTPEPSEAVETFRAAIRVHATPNSVPPPRRPVEEPVPSAFEVASTRILTGIWNWIVVGEEHRKPGQSLETAVATTWLLRLAILLVLISCGVGLRYSIDNGLIGPAGRVGLSLLAGAVMIGGGLPLLKKQYHLSGQGLIGGGIGILYFGLYASSSMYHLLDPGLVFGLMALVTVTVGLIAVRFDSLLIAVLGLLGGFGTPVMLSTGHNNLPGLCTYIALLLVGALWVSGRRHWPILHALAMLGGYGLYFAALRRPGDNPYTPDQFPTVFPFLVLFFLIFSAMTLIYNLKRRQESSLIEIAALLVNAGALLWGGYDLISEAYGREWVAALTLSLSAFYTAKTLIFLRLGLKDRPLLFSLLGLAATCLVISVPLLLSGGWLTACWSTLALLLFWLGLKLESAFLRQIAALLFGLVLLRFGLDLNRGFSGAPPSDFRAYLEIAFSRLAQFGIPIACFAAAWRLSVRHPEAFPLRVGEANDLEASRLPESGLLPLVVVFALSFLYVNFEVFRCCGYLHPMLSLPSLTLIWLATAVLLFKTYQKNLNPSLLFLFLALGSLSLFKVLAMDLNLWQPHLGQHGYPGDFDAAASLIRLIDFGLIIGFLIWTWRNLLGEVNSRALAPLAGFAALALLFFYLSLETSTLLRQFLPDLRPGGVSLLWAAFALGMLCAGLSKGIRSLRYLGLVLFAIVVGKLYFNDFADMSQLFRMMVLLLVGVALFLGSFLYQRLIAKNPDSNSNSDEPKS